jgi:uncharacterized protein
MAADGAGREPTMEEILASIRRIISEDDEPEGELKLSSGPAGADAQAEADVLAQPDDLLVMDQEEEAFVEPEPEPEFSAPPPPVAAAPRPAPRPEPEFAPVRRASDVDSETLVGEPAAQQAAGALGRLMGSMLVSSGATLDDLVRSLLKPMLKDWLDAHLPQIVEAEVAREIDRIRRMAR